MITAEQIQSENLVSMIHIVKPEYCEREVDANLIHHLRELYGNGERSVLGMMNCFEARLRGLYIRQMEQEQA